MSDVRFLYSMSFHSPDLRPKKKKKKEKEKVKSDERN